MKNERRLFLITLLTFVMGHAFSQEIKFTDEGMFLPRMTYAQRNEVLNPAAGLVIWCTDCNELQVYNGTIWQNLGGRASSPPSPPYVTICDKDWMIKNLDVSVYRNGDPILKVTNPKEWASLTTGAYCYYDNDSSTYADMYGKLYNWYAVNDSRGLCPVGWSVAPDAEWVKLNECLGDSLIVGGKMKAASSLWDSPNIGATNACGFTGLPGGRRESDGAFNGIGFGGIWWTSTESIDETDFVEGVLSRSLLFHDSVLRGGRANKSNGQSVRCIRD